MLTFRRDSQVRDSRASKSFEFKPDSRVWRSCGQAHWRRFVGCISVAAFRWKHFTGSISVEAFRWQHFTGSMARSDQQGGRRLLETIKEFKTIRLDAARGGAC